MDFAPSFFLSIFTLIRSVYRYFILLFPWTSKSDDSNHRTDLYDSIDHSHDRNLHHSMYDGQYPRCGVDWTFHAT
jgi:hypothetical protein